MFSPSSPGEARSGARAGDQDDPVNTKKSCGAGGEQPSQVSRRTPPPSVPIVRRMSWWQPRYGRNSAEGSHCICENLKKFGDRQHTLRLASLVC